MEYIDKSIHLEEGISYSADYLCESFNVTEGRFVPAIDSKQAYTDFCKKKYRYGDGLSAGKKGFEPLLIEEQNYRCCYCMGRIESHKVTLEHIIPESFQKLDARKEYEFYVKEAPILEEHVELASDFSLRKFTSVEEVRQVDKFPHLISYVNLTASCRGIIGINGKSCFCNNPRGNKRIIPLMLKSDMPELVRYTTEGGILIQGYDKKDVDNTVNALNLNHDTLKEVRELWYRVTLTDNTVHDILEIKGIREKMSLIATLFNETDYTKLDEKWKSYAPVPKFEAGKTKEELENAPTPYWDLFIRYDWFYDYYKKNYS